MAKTLNLTLKVWRQENREAKGRIETYAAKDIPVDASFLEMLDIVNEGLVKEGKEPIHFDHDCREGICGMCSLTINGIPPRAGTPGDHLPASHAQVQGRRYRLD